MDFWVAAFVGEHARRNFETSLETSEFWVASTRTPIRRIEAGDRVLLYLAGTGFVAESVAATPARAPFGAVSWSGRPPVFGFSLGGLRRFGSPVSYSFPKDGMSPQLGLHRRVLVGGFARIPEVGFRDVISRSGSGGPAAPATAPSVPDRSPRPAAAGVADGGADRPKREKRKAGQYAIGRARKSIVGWTVAETLAEAAGLESARKHAKGRADEAQRTWLKGGRAEREVAKALDGLREHGFYLFHDVALEGVGNVDHVALGPHGFFAIETKSHGGRVSVRGGGLLLNGRAPEKDFVAQAWRGSYRLREILVAEVTPLLCFTVASVEGRVLVRGVRALPLTWLEGEILGQPIRHDSRAVTLAVAALSGATACHPSAAPRPRSR